MHETVYIPADAQSHPVPAGWTIAHIAVDAVGAVLIPAHGQRVPVDVVVAQVQDYVWGWFRILLAPDTVRDALRACRASTEVRGVDSVAVRDVRLYGLDLEAA
ncbi:hypothetical protein WN979_14445 [Streptomyces albidoflavus]|uniref:hypothetical protein n=1 Tax=Streptomyces albidoflavus TaxID=1886 RepID=UPI003254BB25